MDTDNFIACTKTYGICKDIAEDVETRFLIVQIMNQIDHCLKGKKKSTWIKEG